MKQVQELFSDWIRGLRIGAGAWLTRAHAAGLQGAGPQCHEAGLSSWGSSPCYAGRWTQLLSLFRGRTADPIYVVWSL